MLGVEEQCEGGWEQMHWRAEWVVFVGRVDVDVAAAGEAGGVVVVVAAAEDVEVGTAGWADDAWDVAAGWAAGNEVGREG